MNVPDLALRHQRLEQRVAQAEARIERLEAQLAGDPEADRRREELAAAEASRRELDLRLRDRDREVEAHRGRLRARERDLMSGRIGNPSELMKLSQEVDHLRASLSGEEDQELELMEEEERLDARVSELRADVERASAAVAAAAPELRERIQAEREELARAERERDEAWTGLPADWQTAYLRAQRRLGNPVAEVVGGQCQACRVGVTSNGMQVLRRAGLLLCDNCGRLLVVA